MFGKKCSGRANKVRPESEEVGRSGELDLSCSLATSVMQHVQVPVESLETTVKENENGSQTQARDSSSMNQPGHLFLDIREEDEHEHSSSRQDSARIAGGANLEHCQKDHCIRPDEADCQSVKGTTHVERANMNDVLDNLDKDGHANGQNYFTADRCLERGSVHQLDALEDTQTISRVGASDTGEEPQIQGLVHPKVGAGALKGMEPANVDTTTAAIPRTVSAISTDSNAEWCRICLQQTEESLVELGCECRGELAKAHRSCIGLWFNTKGSNKCEICQHVASNVPAPVSQPIQHFWVWRMNGSYEGSDRSQRRQAGLRFHPLWAALLILIGGLLFDVLISIFLGASALPVNIIIGVLVILGLGTAVRLVVECWHERSIRRALQRMELDADIDHFQERPPIQISA